VSTWMIVEDEPDIYGLLLAMFDVWGIEGIAFVDGDEATRWIMDVDAGMPLREPPELALVDIRLPGEISGIHIGERLRKSPLLDNMVIVLITAYRLSPADEESMRMQAGADILLYKPLPDLRDLRGMLDVALRERREALAEQMPYINSVQEQPSLSSDTDSATASSSASGGSSTTKPLHTEP
jgi:DNA-binding response OmpR family regulator